MSEVIKQKSVSKSQVDNNELWQEQNAYDTARGSVADYHVRESSLIGMTQMSPMSQISENDDEYDDEATQIKVEEYPPASTQESQNGIMFGTTLDGSLKSSVISNDIYNIAQYGMVTMLLHRASL